VLLVERPGTGHPLRHTGPYRDAPPDIEKSGLFLYYGANKRGVVCDLESEDGRQRIKGLAADADVVVEGFKPGYLDSIGLGYEALSARNPSLVYTSITHFGQTGPYRDWKSDEIVDYAMGGYMYFGGHAEREPLMMNNNQPMLNAGVQAAIGTLAALRWARKTGRGQQVDVSSVEAMLSAHAWTSTSWTHEGVVMRRSEPDCIPCKDGWVWFFLFRWEPTVFILMDRPELMEDERFSDRQAWFDNRDEVIQILSEWCAEHKKDEIFRAGQELRIPVTPVNDASDLIQSSQLQARDWFQELEHPLAGRVKLPGFPYQFSKTPASVRAPAPILDQDADFTFTRSSREFDVGERAPMQGSPTSDESLPLSGVRVLELTANWAGPLAARHLADLGAEVIKIEAPDRPATRGGRYPGGDPFRHHYNRAAYFNKLNRNKHAITLNLFDADAKDIFLSLVAESDVVLENNSPRVMRNFGLEYSALREANPNIVMVSISGFGQTGPDRDYVAYGANVEASCGLAAVTGYADDDRPYRSTLFYADPVTGAHAAIAVIAALHHRAESGEGQYVDMSLHENGITFFPEAIIEYTTTGTLPPRRGNRHTRYAPQGCYPSMGNDAWIAICVRTESEWNALARAIGRSDLVDDTGLAGIEGRRKRHDELDAAISEWTSRYDHNEAARILQAAGVPAGPVLANWELVSNPHFHAREFYVPMEHPEMGVFPYPGMPWKLSETPGLVRTASPLYGEHNGLVFRGLLDMSDDQLHPLYTRRAIADEPSEDLPGPIRPPR
ncbi:MAG: CoA transferase, partial [Dehalococcoidia bacterium]|nr:CoA transferase [Dehalococcoidia bacterium]